ncbi:DUF389 domain-containing protein [Novosphingobium flavum]|uniref:DUF389 domain-containing protein n=1 Tax=Novosphingobium flavum TaxID=1778672 RepID=A0A7X1KLM5_9SPHN|nr:DUF389 domain-containing protein [Novosphingobium flavum]MBC2665744.1 DUF389 domain-containing protein [Novosphingobium flavum]
MQERMRIALKGARRRLIATTRSFRRQVDKTGLFPDLTGENGMALRQSVRTEGELSKSYMLMCGLSAGIASLGLLQSSTAVVIGAMLISPLMSPIASMGFGFASLDGRQIREAAKVVAIGAAIGILTSVVLTWLSPIKNATSEIIARTEPTLLDLAIATLSGMAGAFATVWQRGATAIGVAIATALMPPLATVGYGLAIGDLAFMGGAFLLFLTNLAAIAFAFACVARISGSARPLARVELTPRYIIAGMAAFLILATPLALTLYRVTREAKAASFARRAFASELHLTRSNIAQLEVRWPIKSEPSIDAVLITPSYRSDAEKVIAARLQNDLGAPPQVSIQQVVASDLLSKTEAIVDSAVQRTAAGITRDVPPLLAIRTKLGMPAQALWVNRTERTVQVVPIEAPGWTLADYRMLEGKVQTAGGRWQVHILPPAPANLFIPIASQDGSLSSPEGSLDVAVWALDRWGMQNIGIAGFAQRKTDDEANQEARTNAEFAAAALTSHGIASTIQIVEPGSSLFRQAVKETGGESGVVIRIVPPPPPR